MMNQSKPIHKSKSFWIGVLQVAGGIASGFLVGNWSYAIPQIILGGTAIIERALSDRGPVHVRKKEVQE